MLISGPIIIGIIIGLIYGLVAVGFVLIYKATAVLNLAQGEFLMMGGFIGWIFFTWLGLPFPVAFILTIGICFLMGLAVNRLCIRPLMGEPLLSIIILTLGLSILLRGVGMVLWGSEVHIYPTPAWLDGAISIFGSEINYKYILALCISVVSLGLFSFYFRYTKWGIFMRAVADDQLAAQSVAIVVRRVFSYIWGISALTAGIGGIIFGFLTGITTFGTPLVGLTVLPIVLLGGLESIGGAIIGGIIVGVAEMVGSFYLDPLVGGGTKELIPFILMFLILMIRPYGLFGLVRIERL
jgi:branched-chain amino acid transport system permease protein